MGSNDDQMPETTPLREPVFYEKPAILFTQANLALRSTAELSANVNALVRLLIITTAVYGVLTLDAMGAFKGLVIGVTFALFVHYAYSQRQLLRSEAFDVSEGIVNSEPRTIPTADNPLMHHLPWHGSRATLPAATDDPKMVQASHDLITGGLGFVDGDPGHVMQKEIMLRNFYTQPMNAHGGPDDAKFRESIVGNLFEKQDGTPFRGWNSEYDDIQDVKIARVRKIANEARFF